MVQWTTIANYDESIELSALCNENGAMEDSIWITFNEINDGKYPNMKLTWDNPDFIFKKFYKFLLRWENKSLKDKDYINYTDIWIILTDERVEEIINILDSAIEQGWYIREVNIKS